MAKLKQRKKEHENDNKGTSVNSVEDKTSDTETQESSDVSVCSKNISENSSDENHTHLTKKNKNGLDKPVVKIKEMVIKNTSLHYINTIQDILFILINSEIKFL